MTIKEIAQLAGVSIATVSKIVNHKDQNINPETRNRVLEIVKAYNYTPYGMVKSVSTARTFILGVLVRDLTDPGDLLQGILDTAKGMGYGVLFYNSEASTEEELKHITALCRHKVDGVLWEPVNSDSLCHESYFSDAGIPVTYINTPWADSPFFVDYQKLGYLCAKKALDWKHQNIGCLLKREDASSMIFLEGVKNCLLEHGLPLRNDLELYIHDNPLPLSVTSGSYTVILSSHFDQALKLYRHLTKWNCKIPSELSLISTGTCRTAPVFPEISYFYAPFYNLGQKACLSLIQQCEKSTAANKALLSEEDYCFYDAGSLALPLSQRGRKFVVLGSINADTTLTVDGFPSSGSSALITDSVSCAGGKGTNQAIGASRLGHEAIIIGKVGNDPEAHIIYDTFTQNHLPTEGLLKDTGAQTGKAYIYVQKDGEVAITYIPGANLRLTADDLLDKQKIFQDCEFCLLSTDIPTETVIAAAALAKEHGVKTILKPSPQGSLPDIFYRVTDIFVPNRTEAAIFCPHLHTIEEQADFFYQQGMPVVIITLGHDGCYVRTRELQKHFPAADFVTVDATGGADAFISALAVHLSDGYPLEQAVRIAQYAAGFCVSRQGVTTALIDKDTLYAYIRKQEPELLEK